MGKERKDLDVTPLRDLFVAGDADVEAYAKSHPDSGESLVGALRTVARLQARAMLISQIVETLFVGVIRMVPNASDVTKPEITAIMNTLLGQEMSKIGRGVVSAISESYATEVGEVPTVENLEEIFEKLKSKSPKG